MKDWGEFKKTKSNDHWCFCGLPATQVINGVHFCGKHKKLKMEVKKIGRYSGKSKSEFKYNDYK
jgi:hypothetical protein